MEDADGGFLVCDVILGGELCDKIWRRGGVIFSLKMCDVIYGRPLARFLKNACMDLDEMLRVDRCRDMDELINFWARSESQSGCRNRIAFSDIV